MPTDGHILSAEGVDIDLELAADRHGRLSANVAGGERLARPIKIGATAEGNRPAHEITSVVTERMSGLQPGGNH